MEKKFVLKIGGSLLFNDKLEFRQKIFEDFVDLLKKADNISAIIVGGGKLARLYIKSARQLKAGESICDIFGIEVSRLNARLLITALGNKSYPQPIKSVEEALMNSLWNKILISGGFVPGQSTTSVAFEISEAIKATDLLILTNVDGIYNKDPNKYNDAKKYDEIPIKELENVIYGMGGDSQSSAGEYRIFDAVSFQIMKRSKIQVRLINGEKLTDLKTLILDKEYGAKVGTKILKQ